MALNNPQGLICHKTPRNHPIFSITNIDNGLINILKTLKRKSWRIFLRHMNKEKKNYQNQENQPIVKIKIVFLI